MADLAIRLQRLRKSFGERRVLDGASLDIATGETIAILGASGSGKSVTLKTINGLIPVDGGSLEVLGEDITELGETELAPIRRRVSYLFQGGALFDSMSVFDNVAFPMREHLELDRGELAARVTELLGMVQLAEVEARFPAELSGGMRKRVAVARALALEPEIILYDEPTTGLDPVTGRAIAELIMDLDRRLGVTSVVVTHDIPLVCRVAERVSFLAEGRFIFSGSVAEAQGDAPPEVRQFFAAGGGDA